MGGSEFGDTKIDSIAFLLHFRIKKVLAVATSFLFRTLSKKLKAEGNCEKNSFFFGKGWFFKCKTAKQHKS